MTGLEECTFRPNIKSKYTPTSNYVNLPIEKRMLKWEQEVKLREQRFWPLFFLSSHTSFVAQTLAPELFIYYHKYRIEKERKLQIEEEMKDCTFQPKVVLKPPPTAHEIRRERMKSGVAARGKRQDSTDRSRRPKSQISPKHKNTEKQQQACVERLYKEASSRAKRIDERTKRKEVPK